MAPNVKVLGRALADPRFRVLGGLLGSNEYEALGRMVHLWHCCTQRQTYVLPGRLVSSIVDVEALCLSELGESVDGGVRIKGTEGQVEWYGRMQQSGRNSALKRWGAHTSDGSPMAHPQPNNGSPIGDHMGVPREGEGEVVLSSESEKGDARGKKPKAGEPTESEWPAVKRILGKLSEAAGVNYASHRAGKPTSSVKFILRRLREDCSEDELRMVIRHRFLEWGEKPEMVQHLTAETLFGREKFDTYLAKAKAALAEPRAGPAANESVSPLVLQLLSGGGSDERRG